jgi:hypothetical protein
MPLADALATWSSFYANHAAVRTAVAFLHVGPLVTGGGAAIVADRSLLSAARSDIHSRREQLAALRSVHRIVIASLVLVSASGLLLMAADVDTFLYSRVFWLKMALVVLLLVNGLILRRAERRTLVDDGGGWRTIGATAVASITLWMLTTLAGLALQNIG